MDQVIVEKIPHVLKDTPQWVCWQARPKANGKVDKIPINPNNGRKAATDNPKTWVSFDKAISYYRKHNGNGIDGIGFVFSKEDPFMGIDLDDCINLETNKMGLQAEAYVDKLHSYSEITPSGRGIHTIVKGKIPGPRRRNGNVEMYTEGRFFTVTGDHIEGTPATVESRQQEIDTLYRDIFREEEAKPPTQTKPTLLSDSEIFEKATGAKNGEKFSKLMEGDHSDYPSQNEGDLALGNQLAFWCGNNPEQIDRLFRQSGLMRPKWDEKRGAKTYGEMTILKAIQHTSETFTPGGGLSQAVAHTTDLGNAMRFAAQYGDKIRYNWTTGKWLVYDGIRWNPDTGKATVQRFAFEVARDILREATKIFDADERKKLAKWSFASESSRNIRALLDLAKALRPIECYADNFDTDLYLLNLNNGTLDLRTGELREHNPDDMISKLAPVTWTGEVSSLHSEQLWLQCCIRWMKDNNEAIDYLQRLGGYCLTGDVTSRIFPIFWGTGKNGKNVFLDTLMQMMGDYAMAAPRTLLTQSYNEEHATEIAGLMGRRLVVASETKPGRKLKTSLVKSMTGDKRIRGRFMRQDYFEFDVTHKTILMTQNLPIIDEVTDAIWDRVHRVEWGVRIPDDEQDHQLLEKLETEWPLILGWFVEGCLKWQQDGYLKPTEAIIKGTQEYRADMNPLKDFITECCIVGEDEFVGMRQLKEAFDSWTTDKPPMGSRIFASLMRALGNHDKVKKIDKKPVKCWMGLRLRELCDE